MADGNRTPPGDSSNPNLKHWCVIKTLGPCNQCGKREAYVTLEYFECVECGIQETRAILLSVPATDPAKSENQN